jgi:hypothetical protein
MSRLELLYEQAVSANWLSHSEANLRNFVSAALRATWAGGRVGAIFVGIVRRRLWHHITQAEEDRALSVLKRYQERRPDAFRRSSLDARQVASVGKASELLNTVLNCALSLASTGVTSGLGEAKSVVSAASTQHPSGRKMMAVNILGTRHDDRHLVKECRAPESHR